MSCHFSIDSLMVRDGRLFGWGWFLNTGRDFASGRLEVSLDDGSRCEIPCIRAGMRNDLREAFPGVQHAAAAGFLLRGAFDRAIARHADARFVFLFEDGAAHHVCLTDFPDAFQVRNSANLSRKNLPSRVWRKLRREGVRPVLRAMFAGFGNLSARSSTVAGKLFPARERLHVDIVFDHDMGGGANRYRDELVERIVSEGRRVLLVTPLLETLQYRLREHAENGLCRDVAFDAIEPLLALLGDVSVGEIHINNLVSMDASFAVLDWCVDHRPEGAKLAFYLHDFHAACPAFTLIDHGGRYCDIPDMAVCAGCLPRNAVNTLGLGTGYSIEEWRRKWRRFLDACDRIVTFSAASTEIIGRAHQGLSTEVIEIRPHRSMRAPHRAVRVTASIPFVVGIIGHISMPKGAGMVRRIASLAHERGLSVRFVVIGTLDGHQSTDPFLRVLGGYRAEDLPEIVESEGVQLCLLPSVCPETYSYVTDEIMQMGLPLIVFGLGAPAERVARYSGGEVVHTISAEAMLSAIARRIGCASVQDNNGNEEGNA